MNAAGVGNSGGGFGPITEPPAALVIGYFDGLCEPAVPGGPRNPGGCACGGWVIEPCAAAGLEARATGHRHYITGDGATNNVAEYRAVIDCLRAIYATGWRGSVLIRGDSQLVINQIDGTWACNADHLRELRDRVRYAATFFESVTFEWVRREENARADAQSRLAYDEARRVGV